MKYLYLASSLPTLVLGDSPPESAEEFLFHCNGVLDARDQAELEALLQRNPQACSHRASLKWFDLDTQLRNAVAEIRAKRHGVDPRGFTESHSRFDMWTQASVTDAFAKSTPLERERVLDQTRWRWLDDLALSDPYGFAAVAAHGLKLQIAARWCGFDEHAGRETLDQTLETLLQTTSTESL